MPEPVRLRGLTATAQAASPTAPPSDAPRPPVLFLPGIMAGAWVFEHYQRFFADAGYASWALNLRGHYDSRPVADLGRVSMRDYVDDALEAARALGDAFGVERPAVVGHSMGGLLAQKLAERDAVCAAVLLCSAPPRGIPLTNLPLARRQLRYLWPMLRRLPLTGSRADADALNFNRVPAAEREALFARFSPESGLVARELSLGALAVDADLVRCPMLVCATSDDRFVPPHVVRRLARKYGARATYVEFPDHGHMAPLEPDWKGPAAAIVRWLDGNASAAPCDRGPTRP